MRDVYTVMRIYGTEWIESSYTSDRFADCQWRGDVSL